MRFSTIVGLVICLTAAAMLYTVKYRVQELDSQIASAQAQIRDEKAAMHVLSAEWAFLNRPDRLRTLSDKYLQLASLDGQQLTEVASLPMVQSDVQLANVDKDSAVSAANLPAGVMQAAGLAYGVR